MNRRGLFGFLAGAAVAPVVAKLPAAEVVTRATFTAYPAGAHNLTLAEIVSATLRSRSAALADNLTKSNALLAHLQNEVVDGVPHPLRLQR